ncbi:DUF4142 domain-containing protein [Stieleria sp. TO1_6]|uniref:DUF4142 domain-containing protein n=1 Tax=Stieleria tagensis TaxID=2956795 RepID=UPI00209B817B|nr:DUF4142 domain-containing protein [Stieleria tagensis]MCO8125337.1 DUF4142 domain-containing protein [Stieleria tagensis]
MLRQTIRIVGGATMATLVSFTSLPAQDVQIQAGQTEVQVDGRPSATSDPAAVDGSRIGRRGAIVDGSANAKLMSKQGSMDRQIASWLIVDQQSMVDLAKFGLQQSKTPEVRSLAETVIRDHQAFADKLTMLANQEQAQPVTRNPATRNNAPIETDTRQRVADARRQLDEQREAINEQRRDAIRDRDGVRGPLENLADRLEDGVERITDRAEIAINNTRNAVDETLSDDTIAVYAGNRSPWVSIHHDISARLATTARQDLESRSGYEFDAALVGMLVAAHLQQEATLDVLSSRASGQLQQTLQQAASTVKQHRQHAEQVMASIKR